MTWLEMGGYAAYVWPVFGVALVLVIGIAIAPRYRHRRLLDELKNEQEGDDRDSD